MNNNNNAIIALSSPQGKGAIALIRVSGQEIYSLCSSFIHLSSLKKIEDCRSHSINHGYIGELRESFIDEVLFLKMDAPNTFTGEDTLEITCHNNILIIDLIIDLFCKKGFRYAFPGEFTRRAVENNKIVLSQAEAINDLINAKNYYSIQKSLSQLKGSLSSFINECDKDLSEIASWCQAQFEFLEEERDFSLKIIIMINDLMQKIKECIEKYPLQKKIQQGLKVVLMGKPNSGKSSFFNFLIEKDKAIVTNIAGTTRDIVSETIFINGINVTIVDTAGIHYTENIIEKIGIKKTYEESLDADIIFFIIDIFQPLDENNDILNLIKEIESKNKSFIIFFNKSDLFKDQDKVTIDNFIKKNLIVNYFIGNTIDIKNKDNILMVLEKEISKLFILNDSPFFINERHYKLLLKVYNDLLSINNIIDEKKTIMYYELLLMHIHSIQENLLDISGKKISEQSFDFVFRNFCIGK